MSTQNQTATKPSDELNHSPEGLGLGESPGSADFTFRILATDGGLPFDFIDRKNDDYDCACVYRGDVDLSTAGGLFVAWDDYLCKISPKSAPVEDVDLDRLWAAYDEWVNSPNIPALPEAGRNPTSTP